MQTLFTGKPAISLKKVDSTNKFLKNLADEQPLNEGFAVIAEEQTHGLGQRGKSWFSHPGKNLLCSIFLKPTFLSPDKAYLLNMLCALAVADWLAEQDIIAKIKWPNDVYIEDKKCSGILIENRVSSSKVTQSIIGLGLNLNQTEFGNETLQNATSPARIKNKTFDINSVFSRYCELLESKYLTAKSNPEKLIYAFNDRLWGKNKFYEYENKDLEILLLKTSQVSAKGQLTAINITGKTMIFNQNELRLRLNRLGSEKK